MDVMASPYRLAPDSPSRQLLWELNQLAISTQQEFYAQLDREDEEREAQHRQALAKASKRHERIRHDAEQCRLQIELQIEQQIKAERRRQEEERQREIERLRQEQLHQELAARKREEKERAKTAELEEQRAEAIKRAEKEAADRLKAEKVRQDAEKAARRSIAELDAESRRIDEARTAEAKAKPNAASLITRTESSAAIPSQTVQPIRAANGVPEVTAEHQRYLEIHRSLKELRKGLAAQGAQNPELKNAMGNMRREIRKCVGQIREGKGTNNTLPRQALVEILKKAATAENPQIDIPIYLASPPSQANDSKGSALLLYCLTIFAKAIVNQFITEAGPKPKIADALGTVASHIFAVSDFRWHDISLIDVLIAKMHVTCPVIFGIYGDEQTVEGKRRLGWIREDPDGPFIPQTNHFDRMTGLSAGFAGISLKNYERAKAKNPYPEYHYWKAIARLANVPPDDITQTHFIALKAMIQGYESKILLFFGDAGLAALRHILIELPKRSPPSPAAKQLAGLVDVLRKEKKLML